MEKHAVQTDIIHWARSYANAVKCTSYKDTWDQKVKQHNDQRARPELKSNGETQADMSGAEGLPSVPDLINCPEE